MDVFFTTFAEGSLGEKAQEIYYPFSQRLKDHLKDRDYGPGLPQWFLMFVIIGPKTPGHDAPDRVLYKRKANELDMRLRLDFQAFKSGDRPQRQALLLDCMLRSLDLMAKKKVQNFDAAALKPDFEDFARKAGWM
jgi:hypothetical protein